MTIKRQLEVAQEIWDKFKGDDRMVVSVEEINPLVVVLNFSDGTFGTVNGSFASQIIKAYQEEL